MRIAVSLAALLAAAAAALLSAAGAVAAPARPALSVIPFPGTPDASPRSEIIFSSLAPPGVHSVNVRGSRSGPHAGRLTALPDGAGTAFVPNRPFTAPERVTVTAMVEGWAEPHPERGTRRLSFSFVVKQPARVQQAIVSQAGASPQSGYPTMHFRSQVDFHPPLIAAGADPDGSSGAIFLTPSHNQQAGPLILNGRGQLEWFHPLTGGQSAFNLEVQRYRNQPVLTWWQGYVVGIGYGSKGQDVILNRSYRTVTVLHAADGYSSDLHEFQLTPKGTALIDCYVPEKANLSSVGGPANGTVLDSVIQELDVKTGRLLWEWHALGHIPLSDSYRTPASYGSGPYDYFHLNSIQQLPGGNLVISGRNTWGVYKINRATGRVMWELGGKHSNFHMEARTGFAWQHDAHLYGDKLTLFDDAWDGVAHQQRESESSARELRVWWRQKKVTLLHRYTHAPPLITGAEGSAQLLANGNVFVGWGGQPDFSEYSAGGRQLFNGSLPLGESSYRAYRFHWSANPAGPPSLALAPQSNGDVKVYASWNGATKVARWRVLGGPRGGSLGWFDTSRKTGFETVMTLHSEPASLAVEALDPRGDALRTSPTHADPSHVAVFGRDGFVSSRTGEGQLPVGCFTGQQCRLNLTVSSGSQVLARSGPHPVSPGTGTLMPFRLGANALRRLESSSGHRLTVQVSLHDSSSRAGARVSLTLIPYSTSGASPAGSASQSPTIQLARTTGFVSSSTGVGQILGACYASSRACQPKATITSSGRVIAATGAEHLGAEELGEIYFTLSATGRRMLAHARGNELPAQITLKDGSNTASGEIALVGYR